MSTLPWPNQDNQVDQDPSEADYNNRHASPPRPSSPRPAPLAMPAPCRGRRRCWAAAGGFGA